ncbi:hypothetical protein G4B88_027511 [Cannabis sativa]|uniref:Uncharacterized protein n=1 Tax=Cannabis sativa TaxID=3483 RepID=A0A7J6E169_CANSA|nr:hypothetical protein G4B88_027511 [Cannabis sativa]
MGKPKFLSSAWTAEGVGVGFSEEAETMRITKEKKKKKKKKKDLVMALDSGSDNILSIGFIFSARLFGGDDAYKEFDVAVAVARGF